MVFEKLDRWYNTNVSNEKKNVEHPFCYSCQALQASFLACLGVACLYFVTPSKLFKSKDRFTQLFLISTSAIAFTYSTHRFRQLRLLPKPK